jgi:transposase-like protein
MKRRDNLFTDEQKLKIVHEWLNTDVILKDLKEKYGIVGNDHLYRWMIKFGLSKPRQKSIKDHSIMSKEIEITEKEKQQEAKIRQLEKDLDYEKLRTHALDKMIDIAERDLKISIRKKSGARQ